MTEGESGSLQIGVSLEELELMEQRVAELEKYLGIDDVDPEAFGFGKGNSAVQLESLDTKTQRLDDFVKIIEDKHYILGELFSKYEQAEGFLKKDSGLDFRLQALPQLQHKANFITECQDHLVEFVDNLEEIQQLEKYLTFEPLVDVPDKIQKLRTLNITHAQQLITCQQNIGDVEALITAYNDVVERLNTQMMFLKDASSAGEL